MWAPLPLCLLSALLATGSALLCEVCDSEGKSCSGPLQLCAPSEGTCVSFVAAFNVGTNSFTYMAKSCLEPVNCRTINFTLTFGKNITRRVNRTCCDTDGCNSGSIRVPAVSLVPNGWQCPSCYVEGAYRCKNMKPLLCTGAENQCNITLPKASAGCSFHGSNVLSPGVKKYAQFVVNVVTRVKVNPPTRAGGDNKKP
ncbi:phospholipase A2 inhibitor and Ly6/PLAUR domain-containing protein-like [Emydura macquarii macquarii]|uniref:phospholipase A2 inhibitor and Ly6/PLAUR domain-containing protein-like n=1 Tax=Emydura macquarii macquarii TaxID=1129001 RepID=UPI00352A0D07